MKAVHLLVSFALLATSSLSAQTFTIRGDVDGVQHTAGLFVLDGTNIPLQSSVLNLQFLHDQSRQQDIAYELVVDNVGTPSAPIFDLLSATVLPEQMCMGNLRFGRSESWEVFASPGAMVNVFVGLRNQTGFAPVDPSNVWFLGGQALLLRSGPASGIGSLRFNFTMPTIPALVGVEISSQAAILDGGALSLTEVDVKDVRN